MLPPLLCENLCRFVRVSSHFCCCTYLPHDILDPHFFLPHYPPPPSFPLPQPELQR
jgi:hypothetical protein